MATTVVDTGTIPITDMTLPPITMTPLSDFCATPPGQFFKRTQHGFYPPNKDIVNYCFTKTQNGGRWPSTSGNVLVVNNEEELEALSNKLLNYPIFFNVYFDKKSATIIPCPYFTYVHTASIHGEYVVTVWPQHPTIQPQLIEALNVAKQEMAEGKNFAVDLSFRGILKDWFEHHVAGDANGCCTCHFSKKMRLCITNVTRHARFARCDCPDNCCLWACPCTGPCMLLCVLPMYLVNRSLLSKVSDHEFDIEGSVGDMARLLLTNKRTGKKEVMFMIKGTDGRMIEDIRYRNRQQAPPTMQQQQPPAPNQPGAMPPPYMQDGSGVAVAHTAPAPAPPATGAINRGPETMHDTAPSTSSDTANLV